MARLRLSFIIKSLAFAGALISAAGCASDVRPEEGADAGNSNQDVMTAVDNPPAMDVIRPICSPELNPSRACACVGLGMVGVQSCEEGDWGDCVCPTMPDAGSVDAGNITPDIPVVPSCPSGCRPSETCQNGMCVTNCSRSCVGAEQCVNTASNGWACIDLTPAPDAGMSACRPGDRRPCLCAGDDVTRPSGIQDCNLAMTGYDACQCPTTRDAGSVDAGNVTPDVPVVPDAVVDAPLACEMGRANCDGNMANGCEVNTLNDEMNCGRCNGTCSARANSAPLCNSGRCDFVCATNFANCNSSLADGCETDTRTSVTNCGRCGSLCPARPHAVPTCSSSMCSFACDVGFIDYNGNPVDGCEVDLNTNAAHCGRRDNACPTGSTCVGGACTFACNPTDGGVVLTSCSGSAVCLDLSSNLGNCGRCGNVCTTGGNGHPVCTASQCRSACNAGFADCDSLTANGCEIQTTDNAANCGRCGNACASRPNSAPACVNSACGFTCNAGFADCNYYANDGCETNTRTDVNNCGGCFRQCLPGQSCADGNCVGAAFPECPAGQSNCGYRSRPLCYNLTNDHENCGGCGYWCTSRETCVSGNCRLCPSGQTACDNICRDVQSDNNNCGACGRICPSGQTCTAGTCAPTCPSGQTNCSGTCRSTATDVSNCGACGVVCPLRANASGTTCSSSACGYGSCNAGFGDCNGVASDGCEVVLNTNTNCGVCGRVCATGTTCSSGACVPVTPVDAGTPDSGTPDASTGDIGFVDGTPGMMGAEFADFSVPDGPKSCPSTQGNVVIYDPAGNPVSRVGPYSTARRVDITTWPVSGSFCFDFDCNGRQISLGSGQLGRSGTELGWTISTNRSLAGGPLGRIDSMSRVINTPFGIKLCVRFDGTTISSF